MESVKKEEGWFCINCKYGQNRSTSRTDAGNYICLATKFVDLVTGAVKSAVTCYEARQKGTSCGPEGRLYEPKEK